MMADSEIANVQKSTHPTSICDAVGGPATQFREEECDDENPSAAMTARGPLMLAPGHDNEETITRRISQSTLPPTASSSTTSFPSTFSSPFPAPYRLEDSQSTSSSTTSSSSGTSQTSRDFSSSAFPPPYRLDEATIPTFPSIRTSLSGKAAQLINDIKLTSSESFATSSSSCGQKIGAIVVDSPAAAEQLSSQPSTTPIPQNMPFGWHTMLAAQDPKTNPNISPFRTRQTLLQRFSTVPMYPTQSLPVGVSSEASPSSSSAGLLQPLVDNVDSFTNVNISEGDNNSSSSSSSGASSNGLVAATSLDPRTSSSSSSSSSSSGGSSEAAPTGLLSKVLTPRVSSLKMGAGAEPSALTVNDEKFSVPAAGGGRVQRASNRVSTYTRSPDRSRKYSRAPTRKKSKSPRPGRGSARNSPRKASSRAYSVAAAAKNATTFAEEDLTGGISNLLTTRRLSSLNDTSAFADNTSVADH